MAEENANTEENTVDTAALYAEALENVKTLKTANAEAKATLRKFKKSNKIRKADEIKDEKVKAEFGALELAVSTTQTAFDEAKTASAELKPSKPRGGGGTYSYDQVKDQESGEMRDMDPKEKKKWRTHARKVAKKEEIDASAVPFDPSYFDPKPAKKAKVKEEEVIEEDAPKGDAPASEGDAPKGDASAPEGKKKRRGRKDK
jgi:hypothetical protein